MPSKFNFNIKKLRGFYQTNKSDESNFIQRFHATTLKLNQTATEI